MATLNKAAFEAAKNGDVAIRRYIFRHDPILFSIYYFPEFFGYPVAPFHYDFWDDYKALMAGGLREAMWCAFRESAKTSIAKIALTHCICFNLKKYINYDAEDKGNAESALYDVVTWLQTNRRLIADFGQLYNASRSPYEVSKKRVADFITNNGVRVEAHSVYDSARGRIYQEKRPDFFIFDDFENSITAQSQVTTAKITRHIDEVKAGMSADAAILYLCNLIVETGSVAHIMEKSKDDPRVVIRNVPVQYPDKTLSWPGKYALTDEEAARAKKVSLQERRRMLDNFEAEMMNNPTSADTLFFNRERVDQQLAKCTEPISRNGKFSFWRRFIHGHAYGMGGDAGTGQGKDHSAATLFNFSVIPVEAVATFRDNHADATELGYAMMDAGRDFGNCLLAPEKNFPGNQTVATLVQADYPNIYAPIDLSRLSPLQRKDYGFQTDKNTRRAAFKTFQKDFNDGQIIVLSKDLLLEMRPFTWADFWNWDQDRTESLVTKHYDLLMSGVIGYSLRNVAERSKTMQEQFQDEEDALEGTAIENPV